jgi:hypothetical protein
MERYKIAVNDRSYTSWEVYNTETFNKAALDICPVDCKLLSDDVFTVEADNTVKIVHSTVRSGSALPGVLILAGGKTYGRQQKMAGENSKRAGTVTAGKLLYKCIPDDMRLPAFLVPYEIKNMGFSKVFKN